MGATVIIVALAGLAFPIVLILSAVVFDFVVLLWATYRWGHDWVAPTALGYLHRYFGDPIVRFAQTHRRSFHLR